MEKCENAKKNHCEKTVSNDSFSESEVLWVIPSGLAQCFEENTREGFVREISKLQSKGVIFSQNWWEKEMVKMLKKKHQSNKITFTDIGVRRHCHLSGE